MDIKYWFEENWQLLALALIALIPTMLYYAMDKAGYAIPFFIRTLAINNWFKGVVGGILGVGLGYMVTKGWR